MEVYAEFETKATPERVVDALTDFSGARLETWKNSLDLEKFEVYEVGD